MTHYTDALDLPFSFVTNASRTLRHSVNLLFIILLSHSSRAVEKRINMPTNPSSKKLKTMVFSKILSKPGIAGNPNLILSFSIYSYPKKRSNLLYKIPSKMKQTYLLKKSEPLLGKYLITKANRYETSYTAFDGFLCWWLLLHNFICRPTVNGTSLNVFDNLPFMHKDCKIMNGVYCRFE